MSYILLQINTDSTKVLFKANEFQFNNIWFWLAIIELMVILFLIKKLNSKNKTNSFSEIEKENLQNAKNQSINMSNLMDNINNSKDLYNTLSRKCHPDRFINTSEQKIAEEIFQEISKNRRNFEQLNLLRERANKELKINI